MSNEHAERLRTGYLDLSERDARKVRHAAAAELDRQAAEHKRLWAYAIALESIVGRYGYANEIDGAREQTGVDWIAIHTNGLASIHEAALAQPEQE